MTDYSNVLGNKPKPRRIHIYPTLDHFHRASQSGWMRAFDLANTKPTATQNRSGLSDLSYQRESGTLV